MEIRNIEKYPRSVKQRIGSNVNKAIIKFPKLKLFITKAQKKTKTRKIKIKFRAFQISCFRDENMFCHIDQFSFCKLRMGHDNRRDFRTGRRDRRY
jgi:hypothetical protein